MKLKLAAILSVALGAGLPAQAQNPLLDYVNDLYKPLATATFDAKGSGGAFEGARYVIATENVRAEGPGYTPLIEGNAKLKISSDAAALPNSAKYQVTFKLGNSSQPGKVSMKLNGATTTCKVTQLQPGARAQCSDIVTTKGEGIVAELFAAPDQAGFSVRVIDITVARVP